jgi:hypothetical protein
MSSPIRSDYVRVFLRAYKQCSPSDFEPVYKSIVIESRLLSELLVNEHFSVIGAEKTEDAPKNTME